MAPPKRVDAITSGLNTTLESFNTEVRTFWKARTVSRLTLISFLLLNIANVLTIVVSATPGWGWTQEVSGENEYAGEYYGYYGVWYTCWSDVTGVARRQVCQLTTILEMPSWYSAFQGLSVLTLLLGMFSFVAGMTYICVATLNQNTGIVVVYSALTGLAGLSSLSWFLVFAIGFLQSSWTCCEPSMQREFIQWHLWYAFVIGVAGTLFYCGAMVGGIFETIDVRKEYMRMVTMKQKHEREMLQWGDASSYAPSVRYPLNFPGEVRRPPQHMF